MTFSQALTPGGPTAILACEPHHLNSCYAELVTSIGYTLDPNTVLFPPNKIMKRAWALPEGFRSSRPKAVWEEKDKGNSTPHTCQAQLVRGKAKMTSALRVQLWKIPSGKKWTSNDRFLKCSEVSLNHQDCSHQVHLLSVHLLSSPDLQVKRLVPRRKDTALLPVPHMLNRHRQSAPPPDTPPSAEALRTRPLWLEQQPGATSVGTAGFSGKLALLKTWGHSEEA